MLPACVAVAVTAQAVIGNYAVPILEDKQVWGTNDDSRTAYMDTQVSGAAGGSTRGAQLPAHASLCTACAAELPKSLARADAPPCHRPRSRLQDAARLALAALRSDAAIGRTLTLAGPSAYTTREVIELCERLSDSTAKVTSVPTWLLKATRSVLKGADWARDAADRLVRGRQQCKLGRAVFATAAASAAGKLPALSRMRPLRTLASPARLCRCVCHSARLPAPARRLPRSSQTMRAGARPWMRRMRCWVSSPPPSRPWTPTWPSTSRAS